MSPLRSVGSSRALVLAVQASPGEPTSAQSSPVAPTDVTVAGEGRPGQRGLMGPRKQTQRAARSAVFREVSERAPARAHPQTRAPVPLHGGAWTGPTVRATRSAPLGLGARLAPPERPDRTSRARLACHQDATRTTRGDSHRDARRSYPASRSLPAGRRGCTSSRSSASPDCSSRALSMTLVARSSRWARSSALARW